MEGAARGRQPLRLLVLSQHYWPESFRINGFVDELRAAGAEVTVLTGQPNYPAGKTFPGYRWSGRGIERHPSGYDIVRVPLVPRGKASHVGMALNYLSFIATGSLIGRRLLKGRQFDAIFVYATSPILQGFVGVGLRNRFGAPLALWVQDLWPHALFGTGYVRNQRLLKSVESMVKALYRRCDLILAQSEGFASVIRGQAGPVPVEIFHNPGDSTVEAAAAPRVPGAETKPFEAVFAGNLGRAQALDTVLEAATLLRDESDIAITLYGSGAMETELQEQIAARGLTNIRLAGRRPPEDMPAIFRDASAALLTLVDNEMLGLTLPSKLQSYLGAGVPVIAAAGSEARRVVEEAGAGIVCAPEDPAALADAIRRLRDRPEAEREAMRRAGRDYHARHYEPDMLARRLIARLEQLAASKAGAPA